MKKFRFNSSSAVSETKLINESITNFKQNSNKLSNNLCQDESLWIANYRQEK